MQQRDVLGHHGDVFAQAFLGDVADILAVNADRSVLQLEEPQQQADERRLAGTRHADQAHFFARVHGERQVADHCLCRPVFEMNILELDLAGAHLQRPGLFPVGDGRRRGHHRHRVADGAGGLEELLADLQKSAGIARQPLDDGSRRDELADGDEVGDEAPKTDRDGGEDHRHIEQDDTGIGGEEDPPLVLLGADGVVHEGAQRPGLGVFGGEQLDHLDVGVEIGHGADDAAARSGGSAGSAGKLRHRP